MSQESRSYRRSCSSCRYWEAADRTSPEAEKCGKISDGTPAAFVIATGGGERLVRTVLLTRGEFLCRAYNSVRSRAAGQYDRLTDLTTLPNLPLDGLPATTARVPLSLANEAARGRWHRLRTWLERHVNVPEVWAG